MRRPLRFIMALLLLLLLAVSPASSPAMARPALPSPVLPLGHPGSWYVGATPPGVDPSRPVLVFVHGKGGSAAVWWAETAYHGTNDMYEYAYAYGYRTAFVDLEPEGDMWVNGRILQQQLTEITSYFGVKTVVIVAHSKGGVDANAASAFFGAGPMIQRVITLGTPTCSYLPIRVLCLQGVIGAENVAILLRQSTKKQTKRRGDEEVDIPGQRREIAAFLETQPDWRIVAEYREEGISAFKKSSEERDVLQQAYRDAEDGHFSILLVFKHDRLSRRPIDYLKDLDRLTTAGVRVWSVADARWLSMKDDEIILRFMEGYVANRSSKDTSQRVAPRMRQIARDGRWTGGHVPYGYDLKPRTDADGNLVMRGDRLVRELVPNQYAVYVKEIFHRYIQGQGGRVIARWLNTLPESRANRREWTDRSVRFIIRNAIYCGWVPYLHGQLGRKAGEEPILAPGKHEGIITKEEWERAQRISAQRAKIPFRQRSHTYLLTGLLKCGICGGAIGGVMRSFRIIDGERVWHHSYRCLRKARGGTCTNRSMNTVDVDANFLTTLERQFKAPDGLRIFLEERERQSRTAYQVAMENRRQMQERLQEIGVALKRLDVAYLEKGTIGDAEYVEKKLAYQEERRALESELAMPVPKAEFKDLNALQALITELRANWQDPGTKPEERKALALLLVKSWDLKVLLHPDKRVEIIPA